VDSCHNCVIGTEHSKCHITSFIISVATSKRHVLLQNMIEAMTVRSATKKEKKHSGLLFERLAL